MLRHKENGDEHWADCQGVSVVAQIWNGRGNVVHLEADGPGGHVEALNLRLYDPQTHQWSLNFANAKAGVVSVPTSVSLRTVSAGSTIRKSSMGVRCWCATSGRASPMSTHTLNIAISQDGGTTRGTNWIADLRRPENAGGQPHAK